MLRFIICEDNKEFLSRLQNIINKVLMPYNFEYKLSKFTEYNKEVENLIKNSKEQKVYILDIELGDISGLEIASEIRENDMESIIIFVTQHQEYRNDIFYSRLLALDYIPKDKIWASRFESTIEYVVKIINKKRILSYELGRNIYRIPFDEIMYIEKMNKNQKCLIVTDKGDLYEIPGTINEIILKLGPEFLITHRSAIINMNKVKRIDYKENSIIFRNNRYVYLLSDRKKKEVRAYVDSH